MKLSLDIPVVLSRNGAYIASSAFAIFAVLLPSSVLTYLRFYSTLIPTPSPTVPLHFISNLDSNVVNMQELTKSKFYKFDPLLDYQVSVNLAVACKPAAKDQYYKVPYHIFLETRTKHHNPVDPTQADTFDDSFIIDCDSTHMHQNNNKLVPFNLRLWVPPILINSDRFITVTLDKLVLRGSKLVDDIFKLQVQFKNHNPLLIDDDNSYLQFHIKYVGFRYYLVKYYYLCMLIGTSIFWTVSSLVCLAVSYTMIWRAAGQKEGQDPKARKNQ